MQHRTGVVDDIVLVLGKADEHGDPGDGVPYLRNRVFDRVTQAAVEQQVFGWVAANAEFGKDDDIGAVPVARLLGNGNTHPQIFVLRSAIVVNSTGDAPDSEPEDCECNTGNTIADGDPECTLRAAIQTANACNDEIQVVFDIPDVEGVGGEEVDREDRAGAERDVGQPVDRDRPGGGDRRRVGVSGFL